MHFNKDEKRQIRLILFIATCAMLIYTLLQNFGGVLGVGLRIFGLFETFIIGLCIAFIVNMPMNFIENRLLRHIPLSQGLRRMLSMLLSLLLVFALVIFFFSIVIPQLIESIITLVTNIPTMLRNLENMLGDQRWAKPLLDEIYKQINILNQTTLSEFLQKWNTPEMQTLISNTLLGLVGTLTNVFSGLLTFFIALIFSIYILGSKESLSRQSKELLYSFCRESTGDGIMYVLYTAYDNFFNFFTGQFIEAFVLALMNFIGMSILQIPYALVISFIIGFGSLIPLIGAVISGFIGVFLLLMISPAQAIGYAVFVIVLQQFDGNLTYPKIVGRSVGLPPIWVLLAVIVGASVLGVLGMLVSVPIASTLYDLLVDFKTRQLDRKNIQVQYK